MPKRKREGLTSQPHDALIKYTFVATHPDLGAKKIAKLLETTARKGQKEVNMDVLDELKREGREEGERKGRVEGVARILLTLLAARFGAVPAEAKARVLAATEPTLTRWSLRLLTAPTLEAVFAGAGAKSAAKKPTASRRPAARTRTSAAK